MDVVEVNTIFDSVIVAHVISRLAGEEWMIEVFRTHGKIYEASASQWFGVPIDLIKKVNPEYALRQKGNVAELAHECDATGDTDYDRYLDRKRNSCYDGRISRKPAKLPLRSITKNMV